MNCAAEQSNNKNTWFCLTLELVVSCVACSNSKIPKPKVYSYFGEQYSKEKIAQEKSKATIPSNKSWRKT